MITHSILSLYCWCAVVVYGHELGTQCVPFNKVLTKRISRMQTNKSPHILTFMLMTMNQIKKSIVASEQKKREIERAHLIRLSRRLKVSATYHFTQYFRAEQ